MNRNWGLIGLDNPIQYLKRALESGEIFHAYILSGPEHIGKTALAIKFAQALNCTEASSPCGKCEVCRRISENIHPDIQMTKIASNHSEPRSKTGISVEQIRDINHAASLPPYESQYRVFIIDEADKMTNSGANALLKTLEEPASHLIFILITSNLAGIPGTVRSRCQILNLRTAKEHDVRELLINDFNIELEQAGLLSRLCEGRTGWAVNACIDDTILSERANHLDSFIDLVESNYKDRFETAQQLANLIATKRNELYRALDIWISFCRDMLLCKLNITDSIVNIAYFEKARSLAESIELDSIRLMIQSIDNTKRFLESNANSKLTVEVLILGLATPGGITTHNA